MRSLFCVFFFFPDIEILCFLFQWFQDRKKKALFEALQKVKGGKRTNQYACVSIRVSMDRAFTSTNYFDPCLVQSLWFSDSFL